MSGIAGKSIVTDGLVLHLDAANKKSYPGSGTIWSDLSENKNHCTLTNGPVFNSGNVGYIDFDGSNDYAIIEQIDSPIITVDMWLYLNPYLEGDTLKYYVPIRQGHTPVNFSIQIVDFNLRSFVKGTGANATNTTSHTITPSTWFQLVGTWNWNTNAIQFYENGSSVYSSTFSSGNYSFNNTSQTNNQTTLSKNSSNNNSYINGNIGPCKIYNRILTATEVLQNYNSTKSRFSL